MSKKILEDIKALPQAERIDLYKKLQDMINYDNNQFSQGLDPGTGFHDDYVTKAYAGEGKKAGENKDIQRTSMTVRDEQGNVVYGGTSEKQKTGEDLSGPVTTEDVLTGEADKREKEGQ